MSDYMLGRFKEVCEDHILKNMYMVDVEKATYESFKKVGYNPSKTVEKAIDKTWANSNREDKLYEFVYNVWREDS